MLLCFKMLILSNESGFFSQTVINNNYNNIDKKKHLQI